MDSFFDRFRNPLVLIVLVLAQTIALATQVTHAGDSSRDGTRVTVLRHWTTAIFTPAERASHGTGTHVRGFWANYVDLRHTRGENQQLKAEIARLRQEQAAFAEDAAQGRRLQALLKFQQQYIASTVAAQVISTSGTDRSRSLWLDKGSADGLKPDQAVMTPDGVVGKLRDVFPHTAQLLLVSDPTSGAGVLLESTRIRGVLRGSAAGRVLISNLTADARIKPGERVLTSGGDQVFPRGLPVGVIESVAPDPEHQPYTTIVVKPAADLQRLEEVLVVTGTQTAMPPEAQADAAEAVASSAEAKRAAQQAAEHLPGGKEDAADTAGGKGGAAGKAPELVGGVPGVPNSGAPRPQPVLHPDRYSPGAVPPAASLTPGAPASGSQTPAAPPTSPGRSAKP